VMWLEFRRVLFRSSPIRFTGREVGFSARFQDFGSLNEPEDASGMAWIKDELPPHGVAKYRLRGILLNQVNSALSVDQPRFAAGADENGRFRGSLPE